jgi:hypothetical protein
VPTLARPPGMDLAAYAATVLGRFANHRLAYTTAKVAGDGSQKLPVRILGTVTDRLARRPPGAGPRRSPPPSGATPPPSGAGTSTPPPQPPADPSHGQAVVPNGRPQPCSLRQRLGPVKRSHAATRRTRSPTRPKRCWPASRLPA